MRGWEERKGGERDTEVGEEEEGEGNWGRGREFRKGGEERGELLKTFGDGRK